MLSPLFQQFIAPVFKLCRDRFDAGGLLNRLHLRLRGVVAAKAGVGKLGFEMISVFVEALTKLLEDLNGRA